MTSRMTMYKQPLERYLANKINERHPQLVLSIRICRVAADADGCNWKVIESIPQAPPEMAFELDCEIIEPLREIINLVD